MGSEVGERAHFEQRGYAVCPFRIENALLDAAVREVRAATDAREATGDGAGRIENAWRYSPAVRRIACDRRVIEYIDGLFDHPFFPFQTLNFRRGSQQRLHSDFFHFGSSDHRLMVGAWVALEDIHPDSGPLMVVPESQRLPYTFPENIGLAAGKRGERYPHYAEYEDWVEKAVAEEGLPMEPITLRKGEVLVWAANLVHGGSMILDPDRTRLSQVTHYFGRGQTYFTPMLGGASPLRRCYRFPYDIRTGRRLWLTQWPGR